MKLISFHEFFEWQKNTGHLDSKSDGKPMDKILKVIDNDDIISNIVQKVEDDPFRLI